MKSLEDRKREYTDLVHAGDGITIEKGVISSGGGSGEVIEYTAVNGAANITNIDAVKLNKLNGNSGILTGQFTISANITSGTKIFDIDCDGIGLAGGGNVLVTDGNGNVQGVVNYNSATGLTEITARSAIPASGTTLVRFCFPVMIFTISSNGGIA